jgi:hypothetical protein
VKQYIYTPEQAGLSVFPQGELRLDGIEITTNPADADLFVCPAPLHLFTRATDLDRFAFIAEHEERHVFFDCSDYEIQYPKRSIFIRCNTREWYLKTAPNTISWPWPVEDFGDCAEVPKQGFKYDVSFHGWIRSHESRRISVDALVGHDLKLDTACYADFTGYLKTDSAEFIHRRSEFKRSMRESRFALCPESINGVFPYRFFEAMSAARMPVLVGSDFVFPFADRIPYDEFVIHIERDRRHLTGAIIAERLRSMSDAEIIARGTRAQLFWTAHLHRDYWERLWTAEVVKKVEQLCASR